MPVIRSRILGALVLGVLFCAALASSGVAQSADAAGVWRAANGSHVVIEKCLAGYCGHITKVQLKPEIYNRFKEQIDRVGLQNLPDYFNKDPNLRTRRLLGLQILTLSVQPGPNGYQGQIYNAEDGNTYSGRMELVSDNALRLTGCVFFDTICRSEDWQRVQ